MTQQHTPGPWNIGFSDGSGQDEFYIVGPEDSTVVAGWGDCCRIGGIRQEANARLIAAAPDLLAALGLALKTPTCPCCGRDNSAYAGDGCSSDDCPGATAIARATRG